MILIFHYNNIYLWLLFAPQINLQLRLDVQKRSKVHAMHGQDSPMPKPFGTTGANPPYWMHGSLSVDVDKMI